MKASIAVLTMVAAGHVGQDGVLTSQVAVASVNPVAWQPDQRCDELAGASS